MRAAVLLLVSVLAAAVVRADPPAPGYELGPAIARDDFSSGLVQWRVEAQPGGRVTAHDGVLDIDVPGGCTVWFRAELAGPLAIEYDATAVSAGGAHDRVSDLNCFWMARDARSPSDLFATQRGGKFSEYDRLRCYYVGLGGNSNTTTRFRRYIGESGNRPLRPEDDLSAKEDLLAPNVPQTIRLVAAGNFIAYDRDGRRLFSYVDRAPYTSGWFGFRTVTSHLRIRAFRVYRLVVKP